MTDSDQWTVREKANSFEDLWIWQQARVYARTVYDDFGDGSISHRDFAFLDQIHRAVISTMNNIAEGFERHSDADFARFLDISKGSAGEVRSMYYLAEDLGYISPEVAATRREKAKHIAAGIASLTSHLRMPRPPSP